LKPTMSFEDVNIITYGPVSFQNPFSQFKMRMRRSHAPYPTTIASYGGDAVHVWDTETGRCQRTFTNSSAYVLSCALLDARRIILFDDKTVYIYDIKSATVINKMHITTNIPVIYAFFEELKSNIITVNNNGCVELWNTSSCKCHIIDQGNKDDKIRDAIKIGSYIVILWGKQTKMDIINWKT
jgi:WD40 repeat protein